MSFISDEITSLIGSRIVTDKATLLSGTEAARLRELWELRGVLVYPQIHMDDQEQLAFARTIGTPIEQQGSMIHKVTLDTSINVMADYLRGTVLWHIDGFSDDIPAKGTILTARKLSDVGGQTEFANTYAAYDALPERRKQALQDVKVVHTLEASQRDVFPDAPAEMRAGWAKLKPKVHPLVWTHKTGRKSLMLGSGADWIVGKSREDGRALLAELSTWSTQPQFVYRHEWQLGDMVMWDNCGTMHRVEPYAADSGRMLHRTTLEGEEPVA